MRSHCSTTQTDEAGIDMLPVGDSVPMVPVQPQPSSTPLSLPYRGMGQALTCCWPGDLHAFSRPSALPQVDEAGIDMLLVGDSVAMVVHGHDTTLPITMDEMLMHCKVGGRDADALQGGGLD